MGGGAEEELCQGACQHWAPPLGSTISPRGTPGSQCPPQSSLPDAQSHMGSLQDAAAVQLQGWARTGERDSYFLSPAWSALFCAGSGPNRAARMPSGRGPPRFILRLALRAASCPEPPSGEARGSGRREEGRVASRCTQWPLLPVRGGKEVLSLIHSFTHSAAYTFIHLLICSPIHSSSFPFIHCFSHSFI